MAIFSRKNRGKIKEKRAKPVQNKGYSYAGASGKKRSLKGFLADSGSPIEDIDLNNYTLRQRARILYMSAPVASSAVKTNRTNVIGIGLNLNPKPNIDVLGITPEESEEWAKQVKAEFSLWADNKACCDATGVNNFAAIQQLVLASWLISGDVFVLRQDERPTWDKPYSLRLHVIEADRIATPSKSFRIDMYYTEGRNPANGNKIHDGVEVDRNGKIVAYHIRNTYPFELTADETEWTRVKAYGDRTGLPNILQVMNSERPDQYRGVTYLAQIIEPILQTNRYTEAEITAAIVQSFFTAFIETKSDAQENPFNETIPEEDKVSYDPNEYEMGPGQVNVMNTGESVEFGTPTHPNTDFSAFVDAMIKQMGASLEIPKDLLLKEFNASYSASRGALLEAWKSFKMYRKWFTDDFCQPVYEIWLTEAVARGRIKAPGFFTDPAIRHAWLNADWIGPSQGQLDPKAEIDAEVLAVQNGFSTYEDSTRRLNGGDWNANMSKLAREREQLKQAGMLANEKTGGDQDEQVDDKESPPGDPDDQQDG